MSLPGRPPSDVDRLIRFLRHPNEAVRAEAARKATILGPPTVPALMETVADPSPAVRVAAATSLGEIGDRRAVPALIEALRDDAEDVRVAAISALGAIRDTAAVWQLLEALGGESALISVAASQALGKIGSPDAVPGLLNATHSLDRDVRLAATRALGEIDDARAIKELKARASDEDPAVREAAGAALARVERASERVVEYPHEAPPRRKLPLAWIVVGLPLLLCIGVSIGAALVLLVFPARQEAGDVSQPEIAASTTTEPVSTTEGTAKAPAQEETLPMFSIARTLATEDASSINALDLSTDGSILVSGSRTVIIWDLTTEERVQTFEVSGEHAADIALSPNGGLLAAASSDEHLLVWDLESGDLLHDLVGHENDITSVAFSRDGTLLISGGHDEQLRFWDPLTGTQVNAVQSGPVYGIAISLQEDKVVTAGRRGSLALWEATTGSPLTGLYIPLEDTPFSADDVTTLAVAFAADGSTIAAISSAGRTGVWDARSGIQLATLDHEPPPREGGVAFSPDGRLLAISDGQGAVTLWNTATWEVHQVLEVNGSIGDLVFSVDGRELFGARGSSVLIWEAVK